MQCHASLRMVLNALIEGESVEIGIPVTDLSFGTLSLTWRKCRKTLYECIANPNGVSGEVGRDGKPSHLEVMGTRNSLLANFNLYLLRGNTVGATILVECISAQPCWRNDFFHRLPDMDMAHQQGAGWAKHISSIQNPTRNVQTSFRTGVSLAQILDMAPSQ